MKRQLDKKSSTSLSTENIKFLLSNSSQLRTVKVFLEIFRNLTMDQLDPVYIALVMFRRREYDTCVDICTGILDRNPYDEAVWSLKTRALTAQVLYHYNC
jgi:hypothetical protein